MPVKIGTTISGTYGDGPGLTHQSHLVYAVNADVWWLFTVTSVSDTAGNPGTHVVKSYVSSSSDLSTATWSAGADSPNFDGSSTNLAAKLEGGRNMACLYRSNPQGVNKDILLLTVEMQNTNKLTGGSSYNGLIRAVLSPTSIAWEFWGGWVTAAWNNLANHVFQSGDALGVTTDGYVQIAGSYLHSEVDATALTSLDPDTGDSYTVGNISASGTMATSSALITAMSNQTRLKAGMGLSQEVADWNVNRYPKVNSIDSPTQVTMQSTSTGAGSTNLRWWQFTGGSNRNTAGQPVFDNTMTNECLCFGFAPLPNGGMLCVYDSGAQVSPSFSELKSMKAPQTQAQGFWPNTFDGTGSTVVFGSSSTQDIQDWALVCVDPTRIFCSRRTSTTAIETRVYSLAANTWSALTNQPPALTGKTIKAGGGVMGVSDGIDMWLFVIDSTDNAIKYCKYTVHTATWGVWTLLEAVDATATKMSGCMKVAPSPVNRIGLIFAVTNGGSFDTYVSTLVVPGLLAPFPQAHRPAPFKPSSSNLRGF